MRITACGSSPRGAFPWASAEPAASPPITARRPIAGLRIALARHWYADGIAPEMAKGIDEAVRVLRDLGATVDEAVFPDIRDYHICGRVIITAEQTPGVSKILAKLSTIVELTDYEIARILREMKRKRSFIPITVRENLSWEDVAKIEINAPGLTGIWRSKLAALSTPPEGTTGVCAHAALVQTSAVARASVRSCMRVFSIVAIVMGVIAGPRRGRA